MSSFALNFDKIVTKIIGRQLSPDIFKNDKVKPLFKKSNDLDKSNFRPVSILPFSGKNFEQVIYNRMNQYLTKYQLSHNCQFRFRQKRKTIDSVVTIIDEVRQDWNSETTNTQCAFIDIKKLLIQLRNTTLFYLRNMTYMVFRDLFWNF